MYDIGHQHRSSYVKECAFHDVEITDTVIHSTVGPSMTGADHIVQRNLASLSHFAGTYRDMDDPKYEPWTANYETTGTHRIQFTHNHAAGRAKVGIHTDGEEYSDTPSAMFWHNVALIPPFSSHGVLRRHPRMLQVFQLDSLQLLPLWNLLL